MNESHSVVYVRFCKYTKYTNQTCAGLGPGAGDQVREAERTRGATLQAQRVEPIGSDFLDLQNHHLNGFKWYSMV